MLLVLAACRSGTEGVGRAVLVPAPTEAPMRPAEVTLPPAASVFVVVMENEPATNALAQPYTATLASSYAVALDYHAITHPSLPNYLALTSGSTFGIQDDDYHRLQPGGLGDELTRHEVSWRAYMEGMGQDCRNDHGRYAVRHNPFALYGGTCPANVVSFDGLDGDLAADTPRYVWITPDACHDGHDCSARTADDFLSQLVPKILASKAWQAGGVLFVTWDEGNDSNQVAAIVASPRLKAHSTTRPYDHYSLLATVEDLLGVPRLGKAADAQAFDDLL